MKKLILVFSLLSTCMTIWSQEIKNIQASTTDDYMIIAYDLKGDADALYDVKIHFLKADSTKITPRTLNGDIGRVTAGSGKTIVWNVYKDIDGVEGTLTPVIKAKEIKSDGAIDKSTVKPMPIPGMPDKIMDVLTDQIGGKKERKKIRVGLRLGIGNSGVITEQREFFFANRRSFLVGPYLRWNINKRMYLQPEILFQTQHYDELLSPEEKVIHRHNYGRAQLMAGVAAIPGIHFNAGLYYGFLASGQDYNDLTVVSQTQTSSSLAPAGVDELPINDQEFGYLLGASVSVGQGAFVIGWIYSRSFDDLITADYSLGDQLIVGQKLLNRSSHFFIQKSF